MNTLAYKDKLPILLHVSVWLLLGMMLFFLNPLSWKVTLPDAFWVRQGILLLLLAAIFYLNEHLLVPKFLFKKSKSWLFLGIVLCLRLFLLLSLQQIELCLNLPKLLH